MELQFIFGETNYNTLPCCSKSHHERSTRPRYATQAAKHLKTVLAQINRNLNKNVPVEEVVEDLLVPVLDECEFVNHWQYAMYQGLIRFLTE